MREARDWYFREFNPKSIADFGAAMFGPHSGHLRMVVTYWEMAAALVNNGAIGLEMFTEANGEHIGVFAKIEPLLGEIRAGFAAEYLVQFEKLIDATPNGRKRTVEARERLGRYQAQMSKAGA